MSNSSTDLIDVINDFLHETRAFLSLQGSDVAKYSVVQESSASAGHEELSKATSLLKEAIKQWNEERQSHNKTKELLRLALLELREGRADTSYPLASGISAAEALPAQHASTPLSASRRGVGAYDATTTPNPVDRSALQTSSPVQPYAHHTNGTTLTINANVAASPSQRHLQSMLFHAAPAFHTSPPRSPTPTRGKHNGMTSPTHGSTTASTFRNRVATPPFQSGAPRFRDMLVAGDQLVFETRSGNSVGLQYKTAADAARILKQGGNAPLTPSSLRSRAALDELHQRLAPSYRNNASTPKRAL